MPTLIVDGDEIRSQASFDDLDAELLGDQTRSPGSSMKKLPTYVKHESTAKNLAHYLNEAKYSRQETDKPKEEEDTEGLLPLAGQREYIQMQGIKGAVYPANPDEFRPKRRTISE